METKIIKQKKYPDIEVAEYGDELVITQFAIPVDIEKSSLPAFHKAIGEFLPQVEVSDEKIEGMAVDYIEAKRKQYNLNKVDCELPRLDAYQRGAKDLRSLLSQSKVEVSNDKIHLELGKARGQLIGIISGIQTNGYNPEVLIGLEQIQYVLKSFSTMLSVADIFSSPSITEDSKWISVEERLPEVKSDVLIYCQDRSRTAVIGAMHTIRKGDWYSWDFYEDEDVKITHWQPLPASPGSGKEGAQG